MQAAIDDAPKGSPLFVKLDLDCPVLEHSDDLPLIKIWHYILKRARVFGRGMSFNHEAIYLTPGQFIFGRIQASFDLGLSEWQIRSRIKSLMNLGVIKKIFSKGGKRGYSIYELTLKNVNNSPSKNQKSPQTKNPLIKPKTKVQATTKKESFFFKKKQNIISTRSSSKSPTPSLNENDVCLPSPHPLFLENDHHKSITRFGPDFLKWLLGKAKKYTKSSNPIGLLIHMLRHGSYRGEYADIQSERKKSIEHAQAIQRMEEQRKLEREREQKEADHLVQTALTLSNSNTRFNACLTRLILPKLNLLRPFLKRRFAGDYSVKDVISDKDSLYFFTSDLKILFEEHPEFLSNHWNNQVDGRCG